MSKTSVACFLVLFGFSMPAMAYIDPGSGSAIMSAIIGALVAAGVAIKSYWYKLKSFFTREETDTTSEEEGSSSTGQDPD